MPVIRSVAWEIEANRGHDVWDVLCRTALRGVDLAAKAFGFDESEGHVERAELFVSYGVTPPPRAAAHAQPAAVEANLNDLLVFFES